MGSSSSSFQGSSNSSSAFSKSVSEASRNFSNAFFSSFSSSSSGGGEYDKDGYYTGTYSTDDQGDPDFRTVKNKLLKAGTFKKLKDFTTTDKQDQLTFSLCKPTAFRNRYLKLNCLDHNAHIGARINEEMEDLQNEDFLNLTDAERERIFERVIHHRRNAKAFNVKLFVNKIEASNSGFVRRLANFAGFEFGAFHVGLDIDGVILEWGRGVGGPSLVVPTVDVEELLVYARVNFDEIFPKNWMEQLKFAYKQPKDFFTHLYRVMTDMTIRLVTFGRVSNDQLDKVAKRCVYYNTTYDYELLKRNCQTFMKDVLDALHMQFNPQDEFKKFLDRVTQGANGDFIFKGEKFNSLSELDNYADYYWNSLKEWDRRLLVCYSDLMNRNYSHTKDPKWGPMNEEKWKQRIASLGAK